MFLNILAANLFISAVSFSGVVILALRKLKSEKFSVHLVSFAAGIMLTAAILDLLPEAVSQAPENSGVFSLIILGIIFFFLLERFALWFHHHDCRHCMGTTPLFILLGDGVHNFIDGLAIAAAFWANPGVGLVTTLAIAAHEIPQEIADFGVLLYAGMSKTRALAFNFFSGLTAVLGGIAGFYLLDRTVDLVPLALAFTAGMFIYISCADLIPELHKTFEKRRDWTQSLSFLLGVSSLWLLTNLLP